METDWGFVFSVVIQGFGAVVLVLLILMFALMGASKIIRWLERYTSE
ncbi:MAG: hypothetical protein GX755_05000 [Syntrophomonadaceae bacterium]|nr:hypothetical protein [Syntrophomonadaceae bacterium]